jgi:hypothetical protein
MEHQSGGCSCQHGPMPATGSRSSGEHCHRGKGMGDRALVGVRHQPQVDGYVIEVDGHRRNQSGDVEAARYVDEARQDEQAQGRGGQMGDFVEWAGTDQTVGKPAVGRIEAQRNASKQYRAGPQPDQTSVT